MGCSASSPINDDSRAPRPAKQRGHQEIDIDNITIPQVTWETDESWSKWIHDAEKTSIAEGRHDDFLSIYQELMFQGVRGYLASRYPECEANGTIDAMGEFHVCTGAGQCSGDDKCKFPTDTQFVLDSLYSGIAHVCSLAINKPPQKPLNPESKAESTTLTTTENNDEKVESANHEKTQEGEHDQQQQPWLVPGAELDSPEMRGAKHAMLKHVAGMKAMGANVGHALIMIFIGADLVVCRFDDSPKPPTINRRPVPRPKELIKLMNEMAKDARKVPQAFQGMFAANWFHQAATNCSSGYDGSTVWDEGTFPFSLPNGQEYPEPTRLLVTRLYKDMTESVDEIYFTIAPPPYPGQDSSSRDPVTLVRKLDPTKEPGGIVRISLVIGISRNIIWPKIGDFAKNPALKAGENAVLEYAKRLHAQGKLDRCSIIVYMGTDETMFKFVGNPITIKQQTRLLPPARGLATPTDIAAALASPQSPANDKSLEMDFNLKVSLQPKHELFGSESQFQAVKQHVKESTEHYSHQELNDQAILSAPRVARHFLEMNFPNCDISDEGPFPVVLDDGREIVLQDTRLLVARDPKQEPSSIVSALVTVPCPAGRDAEPAMFSTKVWLDTPEMKAADNRLLALLKRWHGQGLVSKIDCMAHIMMGKDGTIYKFVDGERFEDYSEERMQQIHWG
ncbi:hypothetical protein FSARC_3812 [Fusarium sarcochroum]|uniref:Uncharacterized protein n=1 Tax=Fusarium sarcochroum TaxID=1208366 RepID=A0A8H4U2Z6_9HYPO|nr:hypothetical protein FSARC_3812 [Fusarium sarcochroum]